MSDTVIMSVIVGLPAFVTALAAAILSLRNGWKTDSAAAKAEVAHGVAQETHKLVNSAFQVQLHLNAISSRRLADLTHDPVDIRAAELAEQSYRDHMAAQMKVDEDKRNERQPV